MDKCIARANATNIAVPARRAALRWAPVGPSTVREESTGVPDGSVRVGRLDELLRVCCDLVIVLSENLSRPSDVEVVRNVVMRRVRKCMCVHVYVCATDEHIHLDGVNESTRVCVCVCVY